MYEYLVYMKFVVEVTSDKDLPHQQQCIEALQHLNSTVGSGTVVETDGSNSTLHLGRFPYFELEALLRYAFERDVSKHSSETTSCLLQSLLEILGTVFF
jgi:hypothetical protein